MNAGVLGQDDARYPRELRDLEEPPDSLYFEGDLSLLEKPRVAVIGSREPSPYGDRIAYEAAHALAGQGAVIVSGMARGLDARAHQGALDAGGGTIAVLGAGLDLDYPRSNRLLLAEVKARGLVVTEYPAGTEPRDFQFVQRNRIIAALAPVLLVVEGRIKGGTSNTAKWAMESDREVFGVPGRLGEELSGSPNMIIRETGCIYTHPNDILLTLKLPTLPEESTGKPDRAARREEVRRIRRGLNEAEAAVFDLIGHQPTHVDAIATRAEIEVGLLLAALSSLELQGLVTQLPGKRFALAS